MMPGFSHYYMLTSCVLDVCDRSQPTHENTHREEVDNIKPAETNRFEQVVLKLENNIIQKSSIKGL